MVQIINRAPTAGQLLGQGLGEGVSQTLGQRLQEKHKATQIQDSFAKLDELGDIENMDTLELQKEIYSAFPNNPEVAKSLSDAVQKKRENQIKTLQKEKDQKHIGRLEKRAGVEPGTLGEDVKNAEFLYKDMKEKQKEDKKALSLNEDLNQAKSRYHIKVDNILRPYGMMDPITKMITWFKDTSEADREKIYSKIEGLTEDLFGGATKLFKAHGAMVPSDLDDQLEVAKNQSDTKENSPREDKVQQTTDLIRKLMESK
jgi:hypothetical protein